MATDSRRPRSYEGIALVAPTTLPYVRYSERGAAWFIGRTLAMLVESAAIAKKNVDGLAIASFTLAPDGVAALTEHFGMSLRWIEQLVTGGASGIIAMQRAARAVQAGDAEIVACIGADTCRRGGFRDLIANFSRFSKDAVYPYGAAGPNGSFALITQYYMDRFHATREDFGRICIAQRHNAGRYPHALLRHPISMGDYLNARPIAEPLHLLDCVMPCAGGEGYLVMTTERAETLGVPFATILSAGECHNAFCEDDIQIRGGWRAYRDDLYEGAGVGPADLDFLQTYDDYPVIVMQQFEDLGFCDKGDGPRFVRETPLTIDGGGLPHNTSGGQLSGGQAGAAGGFLGIVEGIRQLTGPDLGNRVCDARIGLVSGYGMVTYDRCLCTSAAILAKGGSR